MARKHPNLEQHGGAFYYRMAMAGDGSVRVIRVSLKTCDVNVAAERGGIMRRRMEAWRRALGSRDDGLTTDEKVSIARAEARRMRDLLDVPEAVAKIANPIHGGSDHLRGLHALDLVATDIAAHGLAPDWGSLTHFLDRFVENGPGVDIDTLEVIHQILEHASGLPGQLGRLAGEWLVRLNLDHTPTNLRLARNQVVLGKLHGIRSRIQDAKSPVSEVERALQALGLRFDVAAPPAEDCHQPNPIHPIPAAPTAPMLPPTAAAPADRFAAMTVKTLAAAYLEAHPQCDVGQKGSIWTAKTRGQFEGAVALADKFFGNHPVGSITEVELARFFRILSRLPSGHHKSDRHATMSLEEIVAENKGGPTLAVVTTNRHMRFLRALLNWGFGRMAHPPKIDWKSFIQRDRDAKVARDQREAFTVDELRTFFAGPIWCGAKSQVRRFDPGPLVIHDAGYFGPLGLVYTGLRREEWFGTRTADIVELDGMWVIRIVAGRQLKNANAVRDVPIADELIRLQLLEYLALRRARGDEFLFPDLSTAAYDLGEQYAHKFWRGHLRAGQVPANRVIHSTRHFVATELSEAGVSEKVVADLLGHGHEGETQGRYTKRASLQRLRDAVNRIPIVSAELPIRPIRLR